MRSLIALGLIGGAATLCGAQPMLAADLVGQPLSYTKSGSLEGCGVRIVGVLDPIAGDASFRSFDVSANFWKSGRAIAKVIGETNRLPMHPGTRGTRVRLLDGWMRAEGKGPVAAAGGGFKESTDDKGAYLFAADLENVMDLMLAVAKRESVQVSLKWDEKAEWIYFGVVQISDAERTQLLRCLTEALR